MTNFTQLEKILNQGGQLITDKMRDTLIAGGHLKTGNLGKSLDYKVNEKNGDFTLAISGLEYGEFLDKGVRGTVSGISLANYQFKSKAISPASKLPFPVRIAIARYGIKPVNFIQPSVDFVSKNFLDKQLEEAGAMDLEAYIDNKIL